MKIGEKVRHRTRREFGVGVLTKKYDDGNVDAAFPSCNISWIEIDDLISVEKEERAKEQHDLKVKVLALMKSGNFEEANNFYDNRCKSWWDYENFVEVRADEKRIFLKKEQERQIKEKEEAKRKKIFQEIRTQLQNDFLGADSFFRSSKFELVSFAEYEEEKTKFVKFWVAQNLPVDIKEEGHTPDDQQAAAISLVNCHVQITARAGSGKTSTLVNRAFFLMKHCGAIANEMLLLAFNRKAALEIRRRLLEILNEETGKAVKAEIKRRTNKLGRGEKLDRLEIEASAIDAVAEKFNITLPHVMTFHALAYAIVHPEESLLYNGPEGESQSLNQVFQQIIDEYLQDPAYKEKIRELMLAHFQEDWDRIIKGCYDKNQEELLKYRRSLPRQSLGGEYVKSFGEKVIANFLFEHDITYKYERSWKWSGINYRPDFTIFETDKSGIIIEYFGLRGDADYDEMSRAKREYWKAKENWTLIEFSPSDINENGVDSFIDVIKQCLEENKISCVKLSEDEIWHRLKDRGIDRFTKAATNFLGRCRKISLSPEALLKLIKKHSPISPVETMFLDILHHLYKAYLERLTATNEEDFDGLMQRAVDIINSGDTQFQRKYGNGNLAKIKYAFIDEFQDFSDLFFRLLKAIRKHNQHIELFCVGDDWQAINGFAGSDLRFFTDFTTYIGEARHLNISTNYRSTKSIVSIGNALMTTLGEPAKAHKNDEGEVLVSDLTRFEPSLVEEERHPGDIITPAILRLINKALADGLDVVMLSRRNAIPWFVNYQDLSGGYGRGLIRYLELIQSFFPKGLKERISISTAHAYKGLEKPFVIILDGIARSYPLIHQDWVFLRIFGESPEKITTEERRLFYVALTRAVDSLVILTDGKSKSPFLEDIDNGVYLTHINWPDFPPVHGEITRLIVKVGNQDNRGVTPTIDIKDLLKASGYQWQTTGWSGWTKTFPAEGFNIEALHNEVWVGGADGIEVRIFDDMEELVGQYLINAGKWHCEIDRLADLNS